MTLIFVNLKRFDIPRRLGGICPMDDPGKWAGRIMEESLKNGLGKLNDMEVVFLFPEALVLTAVNKLASCPKKETETINIGCQGVFRENVEKGGNFGAFTTSLPASAAKNMGCEWSIIGHCEERKDKLGIIAMYEPGALKNEEMMKRAKNAVDKVINREVLCALKTGMKVLLCVGETAEEKGFGSFNEQEPRIKASLSSQLDTGLKESLIYNPQENVVIGYEPVWAIGPGKKPPGRDYIEFVSSYIKTHCKDRHGFEPTVVYGGGLKEENARMISNIESIDGGLVALTRFSGDIGFYADEFKRIVDSCL